MLTGFNKSVVLSTFPKPTIVLVIPETVPVNVGEAKGAFKAKASKTAFCDGAIVVVPSLIASATEAPTAVDTASPTKAVVAMAVELLPAV